MGIIDRLKGRGDDSSQMRTAPSIARAQNIIPKITNATAPLYAAAGGFIVALIALLVPVSVLEGFTGATGLSEIIPAARAPLGFTARILFVAFLAILSSALLLVLLMRKNSPTETEYMSSAEVDEKARERSRMPVGGSDDAALGEKLHREDDKKYQEFAAVQEQLAAQNSNASVKKKAGVAATAAGGVAAFAALAKSKIAKLPFMGGDDRVRSFDDLPKLRDADSHPDAPPRRPLSANHDLGEKVLEPEIRPEDLQASQASDDIPASFADELNQEALAQETYLQEAIVADVGIPESVAPVSVAPELVASEEVVSESVVSESIASESIAPESLVAEFISQDTDSDADISFSRTADNAGASDDILEHGETEIVSTSEVVEATTDYASDDSQMTQASAELPALDDLMDRLEKVVARRTELRSNVETQRIQEDAPEQLTQKDTTPVAAPTASEPDNRMVETPITDAPAMEDPTDESPDDIEPEAQKAKPANEAQKAEMDSALKSALDTLHKMNERSA